MLSELKQNKHTNNNKKKGKQKNRKQRPQKIIHDFFSSASGVCKLFSVLGMKIR